MDHLNYLMNINMNPLRKLPHAQRFQIMAVLGSMWTLIFCIGTGSWLWFGELAIGHLLFAIGFFITGLTFHTAGQTSKTYRDYPRRD